MKSLIYISAVVGSVIGGWIGSLIDHGNAFGAWGIILSGVFGIAGIYLGYKISQNY